MIDVASLEITLTKHVILAATKGLQQARTHKKSNLFAFVSILLLLRRP